MRTWTHRLRVAAGTIVILLAFALPAASDESPPGERELLQRLFAPCCYRETLDVHTSGLAQELRAEIHARLLRGEASDAIVRDLVLRYESRILTRPPGLWTAAWLFWGASGLSAVIMATAVRLSSRHAAHSRNAARVMRADDPDRVGLEDRLADELAELD